MRRKEAKRDIREGERGSVTFCTGKVESVCVQSVTYGDGAEMGIERDICLEASECTNGGGGGREKWVERNGVERNGLESNGV